MYKEVELQVCTNSHPPVYTSTNGASPGNTHLAVCPMASNT